MTQENIWTLDQVADWTEGEVLQGDLQTPITGFDFDSRKLRPGSMFVALVAERDGHDFIPAAIKAGAAALLVSREVPLDHDVAVILVKDTLRALGDIAGKWRRQLDCQVVGITGSNGKTTTKEMLGAIMSRVGPTLRTEGNFNNLIGLPMTLFELRESHQFAVLEMGMNHPGEIARLTEIAAPQVGLITCVAAAHLEGLGSIEGVARAKGELFAGLSGDAIAVINADDPHVLGLHKTLNCRRIFFTTRPHNQVAIPPMSPLVSLESCDSLGPKGFRMEVCRPKPGQETVFISDGQKESFELTLPLVGRHQVSNALAAVAAATALGAPISAIVEALGAMQPTGRRMRMVQTPAGIHLLDDCYNSNPNSARAALQTLYDLGKESERVAVLGDMLELGGDAISAHANVGRCAVGLHVSKLFAFGPLSKHLADAALHAGLPPSAVFHTEDIDVLWEALQPHLQPNTWLLIKGSRGMRLERISERVEAL